jgi:TrpR-related protein YerC/YecD
MQKGDYYMSFHSKSVDRLFKTFLNLESIEECYAYFEDLCTIKEILDMAQRLDTAILLKEGYSYQKICEQVDISSATVGRVSKCLNYGTGGYATAIEKLKKDEEE